MLKAWEFDGFSDLSDTGKLVYFYLCSRKKSSIALIPKTLSIPKTKADKAIKELEKVGAIKIEKKSALVIEEQKKRETKTEEPSEDFESFWKIYPRKEDRASTEKVFRRINETEKQKILLAARNYSTQCIVKKTEAQYIYKPVNFIKKLVYLSYLMEETKYRNDTALDSILEWGECL